MKRRLVIATLLTGMALAMMTPQGGSMVNAAEVQASVINDAADSAASDEEVESIVISDAIANLDNDALFGEYVDRLFDMSETDDASEHGASRRESLDTCQQAIYDQLQALVKAVAAGEQSAAQVTMTFDTSDGESLYQMSKGGTLGDYFSTVYHALYRDMPYEFYWYGNTAGAFDMMQSKGAIYTATFHFAVAKDYNTAGESYTTDSSGSRVYYYEADTTKTSAASKAVRNADAIVQAAKGKGLYDALAYFKEQICDLTDYNYTAASSGLQNIGSNPWQIIYVFDGDTSTQVVCEGYAKAFKYLCDQWGIQSHDADCYLVTGMSYSTSSGSYGGHMWNVVQTSKGSYLVDVTNCDSGSAGYPDLLFLQAPSAIETDTYDGETRTIGYTFADAYVRYSYYIEYTNGTKSSDTLAEYTEDEVGLSENSYKDDWGDDDPTGTGDKGDSGSGSGSGSGDSGTGSGSGSGSGDSGTGSGSSSGSGDSGTGSGSGSGSGDSGSTGSTESKYTGWKTVNGKDYWYEDGVKQGTAGRGKEIYDPNSDAWYWLDAVQGGAKAVSKDVYQESSGGKWVRYDEDGHMVKGWQETSAGWYYFDWTTGAMAKGKVTLDGFPCWFDENTGIGKNCVWEQVNGQDYYWYENGRRQGYHPRQSAYRGKEIYDPAQNAWFWLDNNAMGKKAVSKDVYQPYTIQGQDTIGKWVRYDATGRMIKGWQTTSKGTYYFDPTTGAMSKGSRVIDGRTYYFDEETGIRK